MSGRQAKRRRRLERVTRSRPVELEAIAAAAIVNGALQKGEELAGLLELVERLEVCDRILELGSDVGGTLYAWRRLRPGARVVSVSLPAGPFSTGRALTSWGAEVIEANSHHLSTVELARLTLDGPADVLFIDADHTYLGCRQDWELYRPLVRRGGLVAFHDICHHPDPEVGVEHVWREVKRDAAAGWWEFIDGDRSWGGIGVVRV